MMLSLFLGSLLSTSLAPIFIHQRNDRLIAATRLLMFGLILAAITFAIYSPHHAHYTLTVIDFSNITLMLSIQFDMLAKIMMIFILVIGFLIYSYAQNYLESDNTRMRFLAQFNLVLFSVLLLVMSANLLTAFVAWELVGINLYVLLNHYHNDPYANRAAKKKFVINRLGDSTFLVAIILAYQTQTDATFDAIQLSPHAGLICGLIFISVMTKCAQFPFHIWLIDTMETPTPVSALMHAGVINAGGILLTRVSSTLTQFHSLAYVILGVGLVSAILSIHWMSQQPDTKKKLAYSTMGQMGYMLMQCSLGAFPAAVFHLISHGFYKASLFLNAGETLNQAPIESRQVISHKLIFKSLLIGLIILLAGFCLFRETMMSIPLLVNGFIAFTLITLVLNINQQDKSTAIMNTVHCLLISVMFFAYLYCFEKFSYLLTEYEYNGIISLPYQALILIAVFILQYYSWIKDKQAARITFKDNTEKFLRHFLLNPLRFLGDIINIHHYRKIVFTLYICTVVFTTLSFSYGLALSLFSTGSDIGLNQLALFAFLAIGIVALIIANRCLSIKLLITYLTLFELCFSNIGLFDNDNSIAKVGIFHILNISLVLLMLALLARKNNNNRISTSDNNRLPTRAFYLVFSLLLLIGIPGTASFISEFYLLNALMNNAVLFIIMYVFLIILIAIVVMHSLQLYVFNKNYSALLSKPITIPEHILFLSVITVNIFFGLFPGVLLNNL